MTVGDVVTQALTEAPAHTMKKCIQDKFRDIKCEEFNEGKSIYRNVIKNTRELCTIYTGYEVFYDDKDDIVDICLFQ